VRREVPAPRHNPVVTLAVDTEVHPLRICSSADRCLDTAGTYTMTPEQRVGWEAAKELARQREQRQRSRAASQPRSPFAEVRRSPHSRRFGLVAAATVEPGETSHRVGRMRLVAQSCDVFVRARSGMAS
jgi:hypothetical protein